MVGLPVVGSGVGLLDGSLDTGARLGFFVGSLVTGAKLGVLLGSELDGDAVVGSALVGDAVVGSVLVNGVSSRTEFLSSFFRILPPAISAPGTDR